MERADSGRTPGFKLMLTILVGLALTIPLFSVWLLVYDRQTQSTEATELITAGWGGPQAMTGPVLVIPYRATATETVVENGQSVTRTNQVTRELTLAPEAVRCRPTSTPKCANARSTKRWSTTRRSAARRASPSRRTSREPGSSLRRWISPRAELRFGLSDPRGLGANPQRRRRRTAASASARRRQQRRPRLLRLGRRDGTDRSADDSRF